MEIRHIIFMNSFHEFFAIQHHSLHFICLKINHPKTITSKFSVFSQRKKSNKTEKIRCAALIFHTYEVPLAHSCYDPLPSTRLCKREILPYLVVVRFF